MPMPPRDAIHAPAHGEHELHPLPRLRGLAETRVDVQLQRLGFGRIRPISGPLP